MKKRDRGPQPCTMLQCGKKVVAGDNMMLV